MQCKGASEFSLKKIGGRRASECSVNKNGGRRASECSVKEPQSSV